MMGGVHEEAPHGVHKENSSLCPQKEVLPISAAGCDGAQGISQSSLAPW